MSALFVDSVYTRLQHISTQRSVAKLQQDITCACAFNRYVLSLFSAGGSRLCTTWPPECARSIKVAWPFALVLLATFPSFVAGVSLIIPAL
ncbi:hypothetical protein C8Q78DRAFT_1041662 [Trametes maxima]|nr:hypothetical protein C8Q78DRAFT_1041662 [Trametes maxima]